MPKKVAPGGMRGVLRRRNVCMYVLLTLAFVFVNHFTFYYFPMSAAAATAEIDDEMMSSRRRSRIQDHSFMSIAVVSTTCRCPTSSARVALHNAFFVLLTLFLNFQPIHNVWPVCLSAKTKKPISR